jgi:hypothetical protein
MHPIAKLSRPCPPRRASLLAQRKVVTCARRRFSPGRPAASGSVDRLARSVAFHDGEAAPSRRRAALSYKKRISKIVKYIVVSTPQLRKSAGHSPVACGVWRGTRGRAVPGAQTRDRYVMQMTI